MTFRTVQQQALARSPKMREQLANKLGGNWFAVRDGFGWKYRCDDGREVRGYAQLSPQHDGDDDTFFTVWIDDTGKTVGHGRIITG